MRLYISERMNGLHGPLYKFTEDIDSALSWNKTREWADRCCLAISQEGINVEQRFGQGKIRCTNCRVETRQQGGFVISCEVPGLCN